jgi:uncharacterized C2H2 Zn-finger protein
MQANYIKIANTEMKFMRTAKCTWMEYKRKEYTDLLKGLRTEPVLEIIFKYKINWIQHANKMQKD